MSLTRDMVLNGRHKQRATDLDLIMQFMINEIDPAGIYSGINVQRLFEALYEEIKAQKIEEE